MFARPYAVLPAKVPTLGLLMPHQVLAWAHICSWTSNYMAHSGHIISTFLVALPLVAGIVIALAPGSAFALPSGHL